MRQFESKHYGTALEIIKQHFIITIHFIFAISFKFNLLKIHHVNFSLFLYSLFRWWNFSIILKFFVFNFNRIKIYCIKHYKKNNQKSRKNTFDWIGYIILLFFLWTLKYPHEISHTYLLKMMNIWRCKLRLCIFFAI